MKSAIAILFLVLVNNTMFSQDSNFFEPVNQDSIKIYFNQIGDITTSNNASFYRIGKMSNDFFPFEGEVKDYTYDHNLLFIGHYFQGKLNGVAKFYDKGYLKETGNLKDGERDSIWTYYANNRIIKKIDFSNHRFRLCEYYSINGENNITNGICSYKENITIYKSTDQLSIKCKFKDGLLDGKITCGIYTEYFDQGKFIKGIYAPLNSEYFEGSRITLISFNPSEHVNLFFNFITLKEKINCSSTLYPLKFKGDKKLDATFFENLKDSISQLYNNERQRLWYLVNFTIAKDSKINFVSILSSQKINKSDQIKFVISNLKDWQPIKCGNKAYECTIYFPIFIENNAVVIPEFNYAFVSILSKTFRHLNESERFERN